MDESWRMRMGMPNLPRRRSTEETSSSHTRRTLFGEPETLDPEDFNDVFGGPPRSVLSRKVSGDFTRQTTFYEEIFRPPDGVFAPSKSGRNLPVFRIPAGRGSGGGVRKSGGFYSDIFGSDDDGRLRSKSRSSSKPDSKSKSRSNSSSVLSSEDLSPCRPVTGDDVSFSTFASKLRPINVPCKWNSSTMMHEEYPKRQGMPAFPSNFPSFVEKQFMENEYTENLRSSLFGVLPQRLVSSPETISLEPYSYGSIKISLDDDVEINSPSSAVSSLCQESEACRAKSQDNIVMQEQDVDQEDQDEVMSSYVIEITSEHRDGGEAISIDEAIAWAKEKYHSQSSENEWSTRGRHEKEQAAEMEERPGEHAFLDQQIGGDGAMHSPVVREPEKWAIEEEKQQLAKDKVEMEMELVDEDLRLWLAGKEANIRLLLSTLHHILWPNSGWYAISLTNLIETSQVKKAYQKARLCLHPDKLQQRGATLPQKYVADKAFSILQDAWAAFISQDAFFSG